MPIFLRPARDEDSVAVADLFTAARKECMPFLPPAHTPEENREWMRTIVFRTSQVWVAEEEDGTIVGFVSVDEDFLNHLYVRPDRIGAGIGKALFAKAKELVPGGFQLWVFQQNRRAREFYERQGMVLIDRTDGSGNEEHEPDALYLWRPGLRGPGVSV